MGKLPRNWKLFGRLDNLSKLWLITFSISSFYVWLISITIIKFEVNDFGMFTNLSLLFYFSVFLLQFSFFYKLLKNINYKVLLWIDTILLICFLFFTPTILEGTPRVGNSWDKYGYTDFIVRNNVINPTLLWYHNWPVLHIFSASTIKIMGISPRTFLLYFPIILHLMILPILVIVLSYTFKDWKKIWIGIWLFYFFNWVNQDHFTAQNLGLILYIILLGLLIKFYTQKEDINQRKIISIFFLLFLTLILTHLLTTVILCLNLVLLFIFFQKQAKFNKKYILIGIIIIFVLIIFWYLFAKQWVSWVIELPIIGKIHIWELMDTYLSKIMEGNLAHRTIVILRIMFSGIIFTYALAFTYLLSKSNRLLKKGMWSLILSTSLAIPFILYSGEIIQRFFLFSLFPLCVLIAMGFNKNKLCISILLLLIISTPLHVITHYGNEKIDYFSPSQISGTDFFFDNQLSEGTILASNSAEGYLFREKYHRQKLNEDTLNINGTQYVWITTSWKNHLDFYEDDMITTKKVVEKVQDSSYNKIFSNPNFELFVKIDRN